MSLTPEQLKTDLLSRGLESVFSRYSNSEHNLKMRVNIISHPEILSSNYQSIDNHTSLNEVFKTARNADIDLYSIPFWKDKIDVIARVANENTAKDLYYGNADYVISAASMIPGFNWKGLFNTLSKWQDTCNYLRATYSRVAKEFSETDPESFKQHVFDAVFDTKQKPSYPVRGCLYSLFVNQGFLTKKTARKMRSDGSSDSSMAGLKALTNNLELYQNSDELLLQFTDSRYEEVICHLADNLPEHLIASIMGTEFYWAKRKIEQRLESIENNRNESINNNFV